VRNNMYMLVGAGGNITVQVGDDGILLVNTGLARMSDKVIAMVHSISDKPIRFIINTSVDADDTGGNEAIAKLGNIVNTTNDQSHIGGIVAFENVLARMSAPKGDDSTSEGAWPSDTYSITRKNIFFNNDAIQVYHQPAAHTDGDSIVVFRRADVVSTGDIFTTTNYPVIDLKRGGSIQGILEGLNRLIYDMTAGGDKEAPLTLVIPGHGRLCDRADIVFYQEMVTIVRDRIQYMIKNGMTLEQVKEARPTKDYDALYGSNSAWTGDMFVEAVYKGLAGQKEKAEKK
jgi:cyclase